MRTSCTRREISQRWWARAERGGYDLVSYMATLHCETPAERALIPAFVFFFFLLYPPAWGTGAAGGCMLIRRAALERIGGIAAIRGELIDDCALAAAVRKTRRQGLAGAQPGHREHTAVREFCGDRADDFAVGVHAAAALGVAAGGNGGGPGVHVPGSSGDWRSADRGGARRPGR